MKKVLTVIFMLSLASIIFAQRHGDRDRAIDTISVSGTAIVVQNDSTHAKYYLDEDGDGVAEYHLSFGPRWYTPDSSDAVRPEDGDIISILGGLLDHRRMDRETILVFEINGRFWRDPYVSNWNNMGRHNKHRGDRHRGRRNHGFGWDHDSLTTLSVSGTAIIDTTYYMDYYYLDVDSDGTPDYFLNFGPYWYQPESGAVRPEDGAAVDIVGGELTTSMDVPMIIVYELNGELWRDSSSIGRHFGGGWLVGDMDSSRTFHSTFDRGDNITVHTGWNNRGGHGGMGGNHLPDSLFCQMFETIPEDIPNRDGMNIFASYEINMFTSDGRNMMTDDRMMNEYFRFANNIDYSFHYSDLQIETYDVDESRIKVKYWDEVSADWETVDATVNAELNIVTFSSSDVSNIIVLSASKITAVEDETTALPTEFSLSQNYPNPFNPSTKIEYTLSNNAQVTLTVYNIVGEKVATLVNEYKNAGAYTVNFNASQLSSGVYFYEIKADAIRLVKKMSLLK
ncbi:MAG: T9SS type A sorting domain-containing protein [Melioribacteraceae bacterium]|nr:T9SS type A sorting domain-containing protein [Melioribacteraceae bacterium]